MLLHAVVSCVVQERKSKRWGDGLVAPEAGNARPLTCRPTARLLALGFAGELVGGGRGCAGARQFFPAAWVPQKSVLDSVAVFGYSPSDIAELRAAGAAKAAEIAQFGKVVDVGHSCALYGCAEQSCCTNCARVLRSTGVRWNTQYPQWYLVAFEGTRRSERPISTGSSTSRAARPVPPASGVRPWGFASVRPSVCLCACECVRRWSVPRRITEVRVHLHHATVLRPIPCRLRCHVARMPCCLG